MPCLNEDGSVLVHAEDGKITANTLVLTLYGIDETTIWKRHIKAGQRYIRKEAIRSQFAKV